MKAFTWRLLGTVATTLLVFVLSGRLTLSLAVGAIEFVSKIGLYWLHERLWDRLRFGRKAVEPSVIWLTGLSGAGKSTIADWVAEALRGGGFKVERLDGDTVRHFFPSTGFSRPERDEHVKRVGYLASKLEQNGVFVVASFVSPYRESRDFVRRLCQNFIEVYVSTPIEVCEARDVKGLYAKARRGEVRQFTGIDDPFEAPTQAELVVDTTKMSSADAGQMVLKAVQERRRRR